MVKETGKFHWERRVQSTGFIYLWPLPWRRYTVPLDISRSVSSPDRVSAISHMRTPWNRRSGHSSCFALAWASLSINHTQAYCRVSKVKQKMCLLGEQRTKALSVFTLSWKILDEPPRWKVAATSHKWRWDSWLLEKNSILGQGRGMIAQSFLCNKVLLKYKRDRESFWHRHQKGAERVPPC